MPVHLLGTVVNCYTVASSEDEAIEKVTRCLTEDRYHVVNIPESYPGDLEHFDVTPDEEHGEPTQDDLQNLRSIC